MPWITPSIQRKIKGEESMKGTLVGNAHPTGVSKDKCQANQTEP
jgi:hypothetical protein